MSEKVRYLSEQWRQEAERRFRERVTPKDVKKVTVVLVNVFQGLPNGTDVTMEVRYIKGEMRSFKLGPFPPAKDADFIVQGKYDTWVKINKGEIKVAAAIISGKLKLKGNKLRALRLAPITDIFAKLIAEIPTEY